MRRIIELIAVLHQAAAAQDGDIVRLPRKTVRHLIGELEVWLELVDELESGHE